MSDESDPPLAWLRSFVALAEGGKLASAAETLGIGAPTVSKHIKALNKWCRGAALFEGRPLRLTPAGEAFLPIARAAIPELEAIVERLASFQRNLGCGLPKSDVSAKDIRANLR